MYTDYRELRSQDVQLVKLSFFLFFTVFSSSVLAKTEFSPYLVWSETITDNVYVQRPGTRKELISELSPGGALEIDSYRGDLRFRAFGKRMHFYRDDFVRDEIGANGKANYDLVKDYVTVFGAGDIAERSVQQSQTQLLSDDLLFSEKSRQITANGGIRLKNKHKRYFESQAELSAKKLYNESTLIENTESRKASIDIENGTDFKHLIWAASYFAEERLYSVRDDESTWRAKGTVGYGWAKRYKLLFAVGEERLPQLRQTGSEVYQGQTATVQFIAKIGRYAAFDALYGERSFGQTYESNLRYIKPERMQLFIGVAREQIGDIAKLGASFQRDVWAFSLTYDEKVEERRDTQVGRVLEIEAVDGQDSLVEGVPQQWDYSTTDVGYYLSKRARAQLSAIGKQSVLQLQLSNETRESLPSGAEATIDSVAILTKRSFNPLRSLEIVVRYLEQNQNSFRENAIGFSGRLTQRLGKHLEFITTANHWKRDDSSQINEANVLMGSLRFHR